MELSSFWRNRSTLVTGASGLLGGWMVKHLLDAGASVVCLVRDWVPDTQLIADRLVDRAIVVRGDICDRELIERTLVDYEVKTVFHLCAQTLVQVGNRHPIATFETNIKGTWTLLEACRTAPAPVQVVVASSDKAYGNQTVLPYTEDTPLRGCHPYDVSKSCADLIAQTYSVSYGLPVIITRCGNFYGGGDLNWSRIVPGTIRSALAGERPVIRSDGSAVRDYLYIEDGVRAYLAAAEALVACPDLRGQAFNFGYDKPLSVLEVVRAVLDEVGQSRLEPDVRNETTNEIPAQYLDSSKARRVLQWTPRVGLQQGLARTVAWYRDFLAHKPGSRRQHALQPTADQGATTLR
jgi:CDP-glucose 4,6-dehydratase